MEEAAALGQVTIIALFAGSTACWLLKLEDTFLFVLAAGFLGIYLEPWMAVALGPELFHHSLLSCLGGAVVAAFSLGTLQSLIAIFR